MNKLAAYVKPLETGDNSQSVDEISLFSFLVATLAQEVPSYEIIDELSEQFCKVWTPQVMSVIISQYQQMYEPFQMTLQQQSSSINLSNPVSQICQKLIMLIVTKQLPQVVRPSGLISDEIYFSYMCTIMQIAKDAPVNEQILCYEQFLPTLYQEMQLFFDIHSKDHVYFIIEVLVSVTKILDIQKEDKGQSAFSIKRRNFVQFLLNAAESGQISKTLRHDIIDVLIKTNIITTEYLQFQQQLLSICNMSINDLVITVGNNKLLSSSILLLNTAVLFHKTAEMFQTYKSNDIFQIIEILSKLPLIQQAKFSLHDEIIVTLYSAAQVFLCSLIEFITENPSNLSIMRQVELQFNDCMNILIRTANDIFRKTVYNNNIKYFVHQFIDYYIKLYDYLKQDKLFNESNQFVQFQLPINSLKDHDRRSSYNYKEFIDEKRDQIASMKSIAVKSTIQHAVDQQNDQQIVSKSHTVQASAATRIKHLFTAISEVPAGKSLEESFELSRLAINMDEFMPEYGSLIQQYANSELPSAILRLICNIFSVEQLDYQKTYIVLKHPGLQSCFRLLNRFRKQPPFLKTLSNASSFWQHINSTIVWFLGYLKQDTPTDDIFQDQLFDILETQITLLYEIYKFQGSNFVPGFLNLFEEDKPMIGNLINLLQHKKLISLTKNLFNHICSIIDQTYQFVSKFFVSKYKNELISNNIKTPINITSLATRSDFPIKLVKIMQQVNQSQASSLVKQQIIIELCSTLSIMCFFNRDAVSCIVDQQDFFVWLISSFTQQQLVESQNHFTINENFNNPDVFYSILSLFGALFYVQRYDSADKQSENLDFSLLAVSLFKPEVLEEIYKRILSIPYVQSYSRGYYLIFVTIAIDYLISNTKFLDSNFQIIVDNLFFELFTVFTYSLKLPTVLYSFEIIIQILQRSTIGQLLLTQLLFQGFQGASNRPVKQELFYDRTSDYKITNLKKIYDNEAGNYHCPNHRLDQDLVRTTYLLLLYQQTFSWEFVLCFISQPPPNIITYQTSGIISHYINSSQFELLQSSTSFDRKQQILKDFTEDGNLKLYVQDIVNQTITPAVLSLCVPFFLAVLIKILNVTELLENGIIVLQMKQQLQVLSVNIAQIWQAKYELIVNYVSKEENANDLLLRKLYPSQKIVLPQMQIGLQLQDVMFIYEILDQISCSGSYISNNSQMFTDFLLLSNVYFITLQYVSSEDIFNIIQSKGTQSLGVMFAIFLRTYYQLLSYGGSNPHVRILSCFLKQHESFYNDFFFGTYNKIQLSLKELSQQTQNVKLRNYKDITLFSKQALVYLYISILYSPYANEQLYDDVAKSAQYDLINCTNFHFDDDFQHRRQRHQYNVSTITNNVALLTAQTQLDVLSIFENISFENFNKVSVISCCIGLEVVFNYVKLFLEQLLMNKNRNQQDFSESSQVLQQFVVICNHFQYNPLNSDFTIISEQVSSLICRLHVYLNTMQLIPLCLRVFVTINSLKVSRCSTLLLRNDHLFFKNCCDYLILNNFQSKDHLVQFLKDIFSVVQSITRQNCIQITKPIQKQFADIHKVPTFLSSPHLVGQDSVMESIILSQHDIKIQSITLQKDIHHDTTMSTTTPPVLLDNEFLFLLDNLLITFKHDTSVLLYVYNIIDSGLSLYRLSPKLLAFSFDNQNITLQLINILANNSTFHKRDQIYRLTNTLLHSIQHFILSDGLDIAQTYKPQLQLLFYSIIYSYTQYESSFIPIFEFMLSNQINFVDFQFYEECFMLVQISDITLENHELFDDIDTQIRKQLCIKFFNEQANEFYKKNDFVQLKQHIDSNSQFVLELRSHLFKQHIVLSLK